MNIAFFADPTSIHDTKWINYLSKKHKAIVVSGKYNIQNNLLDATIQVFPIIDGGYPIYNIYRKQQIIRKIKNILSIHKIDIAHSMYIVPNAFWVDDAQFKNHIITTRGSDLLVEYEKMFYGGRNFLKKNTDNYLRKKLRKTLNNAKYITSTSSKQQDVIKQFICDENKLHLIRTGVDIKYFSQNLHSVVKKKSENSIVIFSPRSMKTLYNIDIIIEAGKKLTDKGFKDFKIVLIDDFPESEYSKSIHTQVKLLKLSEHIHFLSKQSKEGMIKQYRNATIVVMIPQSDGTPVSGIEAMAVRKPLIMGNIGYDNDLFNDKTVWKINVLLPEDLCNKILEIISEKENIINEKMENAYNTALEKADTQKEIEKIAILYQSFQERNIPASNVTNK